MSQEDEASYEDHIIAMRNAEQQFIDACNNEHDIEQLRELEAPYLNLTLEEELFTPDPWSNDPAMKASLESAGWRYAILIGITGSPDEIEAYKEDQVTYAHLIKRNENNLPIWNDVEAAHFVHELTGYDVTICDQWLINDWH